MQRIQRLVLRVLFGATIIVSGCSSRHPSDDQLLETFRRHRADLEQLVQMFTADKGLGRVGDGFTRPDDPGGVGVSAQRVSEYRRLCAAVGAPACIEGYDATFDRLYGAVQAGRSEVKNPIWIHVSTRGLSISGSSKGFLYSSAPPFEIVPDLDRVSPSRSQTWIRHIEGPWYLHFDFED